VSSVLDFICIATSCTQYLSDRWAGHRENEKISF